MKTKICSNCKQEKEILEFSKDKNSLDGFCYHCKECNKNRCKEHWKNKKEYYKEYFIENKLKVYLSHKICHKNKPWIRTFLAINQRCNNPNNPSYKDYGGRGIKNLFKNSEEIKFLMERDNYCSMQKPTIDRKDNDGNYCIENCRIIEKSQNTAERNKRRTKKNG